MIFDTQRAKRAARKSAKVRGRFRTFDSMSQASGAMGISLECLKLIKRRGCPAFRWSKTYEKDLLQWIEKNVTTNDDDNYIRTEIEELADRASMALWRKRYLAERAEKAKQSACV